MPSLTRIASMLGLMLLFGFFTGGCGKKAEPVAQKARYHCPMHPTYTSPNPGDCPICGMRLVPIKEGEITNAPQTTVPGRTQIMVTAEKRQLIGLATSTVQERALADVVRTVGIVAHDERRFARVAPRFAGWVQELYVSFVGQEVEKGEPLFSVYSPELFTAQNEYLIAWRNYRQMSTNAPGENLAQEAMLESARKRLALLQIGEEEIRKLEQTGKASAEMQIRSPVSGHVLTKNAVAGQAFTAGETLYEVADLSHLWILAKLFEYELGLVKEGETAVVKFPNLANREFVTKVSFISPHIDPQTRRGEVRLELDNPGHVLRPDMWANVEIKVDLGTGLTVPTSAVIDTGARMIAFVDHPDGRIEPRDLKIGAKTDDYVQVLEGLKAGEKVVSRALFLIDSESQLKAAIAGMQTMGENGGAH